MLNSANKIKEYNKLIFDENILSMNKIRITVSPKVPTIPDCVKLSPNNSYTDSIVKGFEYTGESQKVISIKNFCNTTFNLSSFVLFSDVVNGGNFVASVNAFTILPDQTLNVSVVYNGTYLGSSVSPNYTISLNGNSATYQLLVSVPTENNPPVITDINVLLPNRGVHVFTLAEFVAHFSDIDGDTLDAVIIEGNVAGYKLAGANYVSGTEVSKTQINNGELTFNSSDTDSVLNSVVVWKARDSSGTISL